MPIQSDTLLSLWGLENMPACDEGMELARRFLEAAGECVNRLGMAGCRAALLSALSAMEQHSDRCEKCREI
jgi:hypothetical protein